MKHLFITLFIFIVLFFTWREQQWKAKEKLWYENLEITAAFADRFARRLKRCNEYLDDTHYLTHRCMELFGMNE